jgi:cytochrome c-type biogenesis protein CcmH
VRSGMSDPASGAATGRAGAIEAELLAPCCWTQTLDIHDSEIARQLRGEIALRVARRESSESIRDDLVARYGSKRIAG